VPIGEALVWIATRDPETVREFFLRPGAGFDALFGEEVGAWLFAEASRLNGVELVEHSPEEELHRAIEAGQVPLFGRYPHRKMRESEPIPPTLWGGNGGLRLCSGTGGIYAAADRIGYPAVVDLGVCRDALLSVFPAFAPRKSRGRPAHLGKQAKAILEQMRAEGIPINAMGEKRLARELAARGLNISPRQAGRIIQSA
jgi:hypothetical protein